MRRSFPLALGACFLLWANSPGQPSASAPAGSQTGAPPAGQKFDPHALKPGDYTAESSGSLGKSGVADWAYDVPFRMREGFSVIVAHARWPGRQETGPAFVILTRHPLPRKLDDAGTGQSSMSHVDDQAFPGEKMRLTGGLYNCKSNTGYRFVLSKADAKESFTLFVGYHKEKAVPYDLSQGRLFLVDATADPPRVEQVKADLQKAVPTKDSCVDLLRALAPKSAVARSLREEARRR